MRTYPMGILRAALAQLIDKDKYVRFTVYSPHRRVYEFYSAILSKPFPKHGRPIKVKAKIKWVWGGKDGLEIDFTNCYVKRRRTSDIRVPVNAIHWHVNPFNSDAIEQMCSMLTKKLPPNSGRMIPQSASAEHLDKSIRPGVVS